MNETPKETAAPAPRKTPGKKKKQTKEERLAAALRTNLRLRKQAPNGPRAAADQPEKE